MSTSKSQGDDARVNSDRENSMDLDAYSNSILTSKSGVASQNCDKIPLVKRFKTRVECVCD